jgi:hypothetical protein
MKYMLLVCGTADPDEVADDTESGADNGTVDIDTWLEETGTRRLLGARLAEPSDATTVRRRNRQVVLSDGPYAETKEWIAGFDLIEAENLDEAIEIASRHPVAAFGMIEIRPFHPDED